MRKSFINLNEDIISKDLCTACGACKGICPVKAIDFKNKYNKCIPTLVDKCIECGMCYNVCPGGGVNYTELLSLRNQLSGEKKQNGDHSYFLAHSEDELIWKNSASGGFVTTLLLYALEKKIITHAAVVTNDPHSPWLPKVVLTNTKDGINKAMQSKYCIIPTLEILQEIKKVDGRIAMVLLPCQAQGLLKIKKNYPNLFQNVVLTIGLMCGNALPFEATEDVLSHIGIKQCDNIKSLKYRDGLWHGELHVIFQNEEEKSIPYISYMRYMADFYRKKRCKYCVDGDAILTDISSGDGWLYGKKKDGVYGWSIVHTHTKLGENLFSDLKNLSLIHTISLTEKEAMQMKGNMYERYKSALPRIEYKRKRGIDVPLYSGVDYNCNNLKKRDLLKKQIIDIISGILFSGTTKKVLKPLPISFKSKFIELIFKFWFKAK